MTKFALLLLFTFASKQIAADEECYANQTDPYFLFATKTSYFQVINNKITAATYLTKLLPHTNSYFFSWATICGFFYLLFLMHVIWQQSGIYILPFFLNFPLGPGSSQVIFLFTLPRSFLHYASHDFSHLIGSNDLKFPAIKEEWEGLEPQTLWWPCALPLDHGDPLPTHSLY